MRKKIEINTESSLESPEAPGTAPDAEAPDFGDHVNPSEPSLSDQLKDVIQGTRGGNHRETEAAETSNDPDTGARDYITALQADLEVERLRASDLEKKLTYLQAEFQTYRRRRDDEQMGLQKYANSELIKSLLPVLDNFERALKAAEQNKNVDALIGGVSGTYKQLLTALEKVGVKPIEAEGQEFDPNYHEALGHAESDEYPANTVAEVLQRGYVMHDRVLRPALVKVSQG